MSIRVPGGAQLWSRIRRMTFFASFAFIAALPSPPAACAGARSKAGSDVSLSDEPVCRPRQTAVAVDTANHRLVLCEDGRPSADFEVALGAGGVDKRRTGDQKTPLGEYLLGAPRASHDYHVFVPVAYPTAAQAQQGYTGSAIGIHGPPRAFAAALEHVSLPLPDWTAGCIAVRTDGEIDRIAAWLRAHPSARIHLHTVTR